MVAWSTELTGPGKTQQTLKERLNNVEERYFQTEVYEEVF